MTTRPPRPPRSAIAAIAALLMALGLAGAAGAATGQLPGSDIRFIDKAVHKTMKHQRWPGVLVDVSTPVGSSRRAYGSASVRPRSPMRIGVHFRIAAITEAFTAVAVLQQVEKGRLGLSDKVSRWVRVPNASRITVRQLLAMRSGLYDFAEDPAFVRALRRNPQMHFSPAEAIAIVRSHKPVFNPGARSRYNSSDYILLGVILRRLTRRSPQQLIARNVVAAARLRHTSYPRGALPPRPYSHGYLAVGREPRRNLSRLNPDIPFTAGAMASTAQDLDSWAKTLSTGTLLSTRMHDLQVRSAGRPKAGFSTGLGIMRFGDWLGYGGAGFGFATAAFYEPSTGAHITVVANASGRQRAEPLSLFATIAKRLQRLAPPSSVQAPVVSGTPRAERTLGASSGQWEGTPPIKLGYQWQRCDVLGRSCQSIPNATGSTYVLTTLDVGSRLRVVVGATNRFGYAYATSSPTDVIGSARDPVVVAVGDIACAPGDLTDPCKQQATATLAANQHPDDVFVLGDNQYNSGALAEYESSYNLSWGRFNSIAYPIPGNHEYGTPGAAGYFGYFGPRAGPAQAYRSFNLGTWHVVSLNSNCSDSQGCQDSLQGGTTAAQDAWLRADLGEDRSACTLAYWHHPLFARGFVGDSPGVAPMWSALQGAGSDLVLNGHDHMYERYAQQDAAGNRVSTGIRELIAGTGGESLFAINGPARNAEVTDNTHFGVLILTLHPTSYDWTFKATDGSVLDRGTTACHGPASLSGNVGSSDRGAANAASAYEPGLLFDAHPARVSRRTAAHRGLPVAIYCSRACDVTINAWLRRGRRLIRISSYRETEDSIPRAHSRILLRLPKRGPRIDRGRLLLDFVASDAAGHERALRRLVRLT